MKRLLLIPLLLAFTMIANAGINVISQTPTEIELEFVLDSYSVENANGFSVIRVEGAGYPETIGAPSLPMLEFKAGIPPYGFASATILTLNEENQTLTQRIRPVPLPYDNQGISDYRYDIAEEHYRKPPQDYLIQLEKQSFREHPYIPFVINPILYDGQYGIRILRYARILLKISGDTSQKSGLRTDPMAEHLLSQLVNPENARTWRESTRSTINFADFNRSPWWARIETDKPGIYRINFAQLSGFPRDLIDPRTFRLFATSGAPLNQNAISPGDAFTEIPIQVIGEDDGVFDPSDYIVFYGTDRSGYSKNNIYQNSDQSVYYNPYSENSVYWLTFAGDFAGPPYRIPYDATIIGHNTSRESHRAVVHVEEEIHRRNITGFNWYMTRMFGSSTQDYSFDINLPDLDSTEPQKLEMRFRQENTAANTQHRIQIYVNGVIVPSNGPDTSVHTWIGNTVFLLAAETTSFSSGSNRITIRALRSQPDNFFLDYYRITYSQKLIKSNSQYSVNAYQGANTQGVRYLFAGSSAEVQVYKSTSPGQITRIPLFDEAGAFYFTGTGNAETRFIVSKPTEMYSPALINVLQPTDLSVMDSPIQSVIVTPAEFLTQANELAELYNQNWGLSTKVVLQSDIFDQFNGGYPDPMAIRQYLRYVYHNAPEPKLTSLTLLGMGTIDWRNFSGEAAESNRVMIFQHHSNYITADDYFGMLTSLSHPEIAIGRYPVNNTNELNTMLRNLRNYTQKPMPGLWRNNVLLLADDNVNGDVTNDWQHTRDMESLSKIINPSVLMNKIFAADYETDEFLNKPRVRDEMFSNINDGQLIWYYVGHGAFDTLAMQNYFTGSTDMGRFNNPDMLPLFIAASCEVSSFDHWAYNSLGQRTVLLENRGAIASVGATRKSFPDPNHELMRRFVPNMTNDRMPVGIALTAAKISFTQSVNNDAMYVILGDPNIHIVPPLHSPSVFANIDSDTEPTMEDVTFHSRNLARFTGSFASTGIAGTAQILALDPGYSYSISGNLVSKPGKHIFRGNVSVENSSFNTSFLIPDDVTPGANGLVLAYIWDPLTKKDFSSYYHPLKLSDEVLPDAPGNASPPQIEIFLGSYDFRPGDTVNTSPILYAKISDENGINLTGSAGHNILLVINNSLQPIPVTEYFSYDADSYSAGTLIYQLPELKEGPNSIQLIAFDNFNLPEVASTHFIAKKSGDISLENLLVYPNPIRNSGHITFIISENADYTLDIFSMNGKRLKRMEGIATQGFNKIPFDGKDQFGDALANNTYFVRIRAKTPDGKSIEKRERLVIYK